MELLKDVIRSANTCAEYFSEYGELDFSEESIQLVDQILESIIVYWSEEPSSLNDFIVNTSSSLFGCYVLELARRKLGGEYRWSSKFKQPVLMMGMPEFKLSIMAVDKIRARLENKNVDESTEEYISLYFKEITSHFEKCRLTKGINILII